MKSEHILFLSARDVRELLSMGECIAAVERAFLLYGQGQTQPPAVLGLHVRDGGFHIKAGVLPLGRKYFAAKVNANFPDNRARLALPTIQGIIILCDAENGVPLAVVDSRDITSLRTGAATAVAAKYLARPGSRTVTICGCGTQGRTQLAAVTRFFPLEEVFAYDKSPDRAADFARELGLQWNISIQPTDDLFASLQASDICITCTTSQKAFISERDVRPGIFIAAVGADNPLKQEIHPSLLSLSKIVCDITEQCAVMGDLHHALKAGIVKHAAVYAELGEIVAGKKPGRESEEEIIVFDSTGMALQDVAATATVYEKALREKAGTFLPLAA